MFMSAFGVNRQLRPQLEEQFHLLATVRDKETLIQGLVDAARLLEFDYFAYGLRISYHFNSPHFELVNNYPDTWQNAYVSKDYLSVDPTVQHGMKSISPLVWEEDLFSDARDFWEDANAHGLSHGWAQSSFSSPGVSGMLTLARGNDSISDSELQFKTPLLIWFNQLAQTGLQKFLLPEVLPESMVKTNQARNRNSTLDS